MCGNGGLCVERRMPASSGDPVSTALHMSLAGNKCSTLKKDDLDTKIVASTRRVLLTEIPYEASGSYSTTVLDSLKSKYIVLNTNISDTKVEVKVKSELKNSPKDCSSAVVLNANVCDRVEVKVKNDLKDSCSKDYSPKKVKLDVSLPTPKRILYPPEAIQLGWQSSTPIGSGMINMGNTCYLNSTLQALFHVPAFVNWILNDKTHSSKCGVLNGTGHNECLICTVMKTLQFSQRNSGSPIKPIQIYSKLKSICKHLVHGHQEDAHEFLRYLIESMERSYLTIVQGTKLDSYSKETTPLNQIFGGYLRTEVTCLECRHVSTTFQHFQDLLLDIRTVGSVEDALEAYFGREQLGEGEEAYRCEQCHRRVAATKKFSIQKAPNVLCMQLKRFGIMGGKISKHVSLKQKLDLSRFMHPSGSAKGDLSYRLVSMISHIGPSASCGHYTAMASSSSGCFYLFDDSMVRQVPLQTVLSTNAYVIMYELEASSVHRPSKPSSSVTANASNGISNKTLQNGVSQSPLLIHKQSLILSPSKAERAIALSAASSSSTPSSSSSSVSSTTQSNSSPKHSKLVNGLSSPSKSLVPYTPNESSDSESENASGYRSTKQFGLQSSALKEHKNGVVTSSVNGIGKDVLPKSQSLFTPDKISSAKESSSPSLLKLNFSPSTTSTSSSLSPSKSSSSIFSNGIVKKDKSAGSSQSTGQLLSKKSVDEPPALIMNGWHVSESLNSPNGSAGSSSGSNNSLGCAVGQWNVTEVVKTRQDERNETVTTETKSSTSSATTSAGESCHTNNNQNNNNSCISNGNVSNNNNNSNNNTNSSSSCSSISSLSGNSSSREWNNSSGVNGSSSSKMWDGSRNSETVNELLKMSHRGYAGSNVSTWNGNKSEVEKEVENEKQEQRKRSYSNLYDEDLDRGKVKKVKNYAYSSSKSDCNGSRRFNPFQEHQNRKNSSWHNNGNGGNSGKRHLFYRKYNNIDNRFHKARHVYRNQNSYNHWRH